MSNRRKRNRATQTSEQEWVRFWDWLRKGKPKHTGLTSYQARIIFDYVHARYVPKGDK